MNLTLADAVVIVGALMSLFSFVKVLTSPLSRIEKTEKDVQEIKEELSQRKQIDRAMLNGLQAMINHILDNNNTDKLRDSRDELQHAITEVLTK